MDSVAFPSILTLQPNRVSGRFNVIDEVVFVQLAKDQYAELSQDSQAFINSLADSTRPTFEQLISWFGPKLTRINSTAHPTFQYNGSPANTNAVPESNPAVTSPVAPETVAQELEQLRGEVAELKSEIPAQPQTEPAPATEPAQAEPSQPESQPAE